MVDNLYSHGIMDSKHLKEMADHTVCATGIKACAYGDCEECRLTTHQTLKAATEEIVQVVQWSVERTGKEEGKTITLKKEVQRTVAELVSHFQDGHLKFRKHPFNIRWQYGAYRKLREASRPTSA